MELNELKEKIRSAGVIGAGGAGFPTHMKLTSNIDTVLVNASECEPLLYTDFTILRHHLDRVVAGAGAVRSALGAKETVIGLKKGNAVRLNFPEGYEAGEQCRIKTLPDAYPMGDEIVLIYQALERVVPPGQLPSSVGAVVINVETALNVANSLEGIPVTRKWLTIGGDVARPVVCRVPVGSSVQAVLEAAGVSVPPGHVVVDGGPAMGNPINPLVAVVTKKTKSLLILPDSIPAVVFKMAPVERMLLRTSSACCQCFRCTELCPRHLLGYPLEPHRTLRGAAAAASYEMLATASLCSGCGVCTLMACCQGIAPSMIMTQVKRELSRKRAGYRSDTATVPDPERENRLVPDDSFRRRIGVEEFDRIPEFIGDLPVRQRHYALPLSQHVGKPSFPVVKEGDHVEAGSMVAKAEEGISAALHTPVAGTVGKISGDRIEITADEVNESWNIR